MSHATRRPLFAMLLLSSLAAPVLAAPTQPPEVIAGSGRYEVAPAASIGWRPKAYAGQVTVEDVAARDGLAVAGQKLASLTLDDLDDALADARRMAAQAARLVTQQEEDLRALGPAQDIALQRARSELAAARERAAYWLAQDRADTVQKAKDELAAADARVKEDREELRQLEQMYKEARIDSSTQDLVVGRERRKLRLSETALEVSRRRHQHYMTVELPQFDTTVALAADEAQGRMEAAQRQLEREKIRQTEALEAAKRSLEQARKRVADLEADGVARVLTAPAGGRLEGLSIKAGDKLKSGQELAKIWEEGRGLVRIEVQAASLRALAPGTAVRLRFPELGNPQVSGEVAEVAFSGRPEGGKTLFAAVIKIPKAPAGARPGLKVEVLQ